MLKGIQVKLINFVEVGKDDFDKSIVKEVEHLVDNVLVAPTSLSQDIPTNLNLGLSDTTYTLAIPKGDNHEWENSKVYVFGKCFRTKGKPVEGIESMIPLSWNKKIEIEAVE